MNIENLALKVLVIDDHKVARDGLKILLLSLKKHFDITVWDAASGEDGLRRMDMYQCNLVLVDYELPGIAGPETVLRLRRSYPDVWIFAISHNIEVAYIEEMQEAGINGYLRKGLEPPEMLEAIRTVQHGKMYFSSEVSLKLLQSRELPVFKSKWEEPRFTRREIEVLGLLAEGNTNEQIANQLCVAKRTIDSHRQNMIGKFNAKNVADLVRIGFRMGHLK